MPTTVPRMRTSPASGPASGTVSKTTSSMELTTTRRLAPWGGRAHHAVYPPSATSTDPVMNDAASLARKTTLGAISSGIA